MAERWQDIPGYEGLYAASNAGRIMSKVRGHRVMKPTFHRDGYRKFNLRNAAGVRRTMHVHRAVALAFLGPRPAGALIDHRDGDHENDAADNLRYVTPTESNGNCKRKGQSRQYTGTPCVYRHGLGGFFARVNVPKKTRLGRFRTIAEAREAVTRWYRKIGASLKPSGRKSNG